MNMVWRGKTCFAYLIDFMATCKWAVWLTSFSVNDAVDIRVDDAVDIPC